LLVITSVSRFEAALTRILLELNASEDPIWTYFDSQHKHIMDRMSTACRTGVTNIDGASPLRCRGAYRLTCMTAMKSRTTPDLSPPNALRQVLGAQLQICLAALESKAPEVVVGELSYSLVNLL
jgi:exocyst complex component 2